MDSWTGTGSRAGIVDTDRWWLLSHHHGYHGLFTGTFGDFLQAVAAQSTFWIRVCIAATQEATATHVEDCRHARWQADLNASAIDMGIAPLVAATPQFRLESLCATTVATLVGPQLRGSTIAEYHMASTGRHGFTPGTACAAPVASTSTPEQGSSGTGTTPSLFAWPPQRPTPTR